MIVMVKVTKHERLRFISFFVFHSMLDVCVREADVHLVGFVLLLFTLFFSQPEIAPTAIVLYGAHGKTLNFCPEELRKVCFFCSIFFLNDIFFCFVLQPPENFEGNQKLLDQWDKQVPVYMGKAQRETAFQRMSLDQIRTIMERSVVQRLKKRDEDRKKRNRGKKQQQMATECVMLRNMVDRGQLSEEIKEDIISEMDRFGSVLRATAYEVEDPECPKEEAVRIFIQFATKKEALNAHEKMHMRVFDGRYVACSFFPPQRWNAGDLKPDPATEQRLPPKCREPVSAEDLAQPAAPGVAAVEADPSAEATQAPQATSRPADLTLPEKRLPPFVQALIDVLAAAAEGTDISEEMISKADPVYRKRQNEKRKEQDAEASRVLSKVWGLCWLVK